ncbi:hypothetical protein ARMSODRAFT_1011319 [Armillaria solidipes]|uniref:Uncharacterized protein n=1 Tax=Armillaria solidipes TaxID=1076256 RepID=A0A2H3C6T8_9AGAR|nr:hypothetical protein ARMSODRAFT_1011319 [Armillaria solidipes]
MKDPDTTTTGFQGKTQGFVRPRIGNASAHRDASLVSDREENWEFNIPEPVVSPPAPAETPFGPHAPPFFFIVSSLPLSVCEQLVDRVFWQLPLVTFFAIPYNPVITSFIVTLDHFAADDNPNEAVEIKTIVQLAMQNSPAVMTFLTHHRDTLANLSLAGAITHIANRLEVHALNIAAPGGQLRTVFNVYAPSPTNDPTLHAQWVSTIASLNFLSTAYGAGHPLKSTFACNKCKSIDHPTGLCPFPPPASSMTTAQPIQSAPASPSSPSPRGRRNDTRGRNITPKRARGRGF